MQDVTQSYFYLEFPRFEFNFPSKPFAIQSLKSTICSTICP